LAHAARESGATFILNDRADLARIARAAGVHIGQTDLPPADARRILGPDAIVGISTHNAAELDAAMRAPVDYVAVGAVFRTAMKGPTHPTVGLELVRHAAALGEAHNRPIVAIGGITLDTAVSVIEAGAAAVAVITDLLADGNPRQRALDFLRALQ